MEKTLKIYQNNKGFEEIYSFITLIFFGKTMVLWKQKLQYYEKKTYGIIPKTMELCLTKKKQKNYSKLQLTIVNYSLLQNFICQENDVKFIILSNVKNEFETFEPTV